MTAQAKAMFGKFPLVGGLLASIVGLVLPAGLGALSVAPTAYLAKMLAPYIPGFPSVAFYPAVGLLLAALVEKFAPLDAPMRRNIAVAMASAGGAVGYYKYITGQTHEVAGELGMLEGYGAYGEGLASEVVPFGDGSESWGDYGAASKRRAAWIRHLLGPKHYKKFKALPHKERHAIMVAIRKMARQKAGQKLHGGGRPALPGGQSGQKQIEQQGDLEEIGGEEDYAGWGFYPGELGTMIFGA